MAHITMDDVNAYITASKNVIDIFKSMVSFLPKGDNQSEVEKRLADAERALKAAEVQLAKSLGYNLCQCTFPPQIMLSQGRHSKYHEEVFKCGNCSKQVPSEGHFQELDKIEADQRAALAARRNWMA